MNIPFSKGTKVSLDKGKDGNTSYIYIYIYSFIYVYITYKKSLDLGTQFSKRPWFQDDLPVTGGLAEVENIGTIFTQSLLYFMLQGVWKTKIFLLKELRVSSSWCWYWNLWWVPKKVWFDFSWTLLEGWDVGQKVWTKRDVMQACLYLKLLWSRRYQQCLGPSRGFKQEIFLHESINFLAWSRWWCQTIFVNVAPQPIKLGKWSNLTCAYCSQRSGSTAN